MSADSHDPLCGAAMSAYPTGAMCYCALIARVQAAERERIAQAVKALLDEMHSDWSNPRYRAVLDLIARNGGSDDS